VARGRVNRDSTLLFAVAREEDLAPTPTAPSTSCREHRLYSAVWSDERLRESATDAPGVCKDASSERVVARRAPATEPNADQPEVLSVKLALASER